MHVFGTTNKFQASWLLLVEKRSERLVAPGSDTKEDEAVRHAVPFLACGDIGAGDSDANYDLDPEQYIHREPVQPPTTPAYKTALELLRRQQRQEPSD